MVIPLAVRRRLRLEAGAKLSIVDFNGGLRLMPLQPPSALKLAREAGDETAAAALALDAAVLALPMADSLTYATARRHGAVLWTQDAHFDGLPGVRCFAKPRS